jgi:hypothetical protein
MFFFPLQCTPLCGAKGRKLRTLSCVWVSTKLPAYNVCRNKAKPSVSKTCKPAKCRHSKFLTSVCHCKYEYIILTTSSERILIPYFKQASLQRL